MGTMMESVQKYSHVSLSWYFGASYSHYLYTFPPRLVYICFQLENKKKAELAKAAGVSLMMLEANDSMESSVISPFSRNNQGSLLNEVDDELKDEWSNLAGNTDTTIVDGKVVAKDTLKGVRVGSAGGWSLEVFPGDFVVHR